MTSKMSWQDRLEKVLEDWDRAIVDRPGEENDPDDTTLRRMHVSSLLDKCDRNRRSEEFDAAVRNGLQKRRLYMHPILEGHLPANTLLKISRTPVPEPDLHFPTERAFQDFMEADYARLDVFSGLSLIKPQHKLPDGRKIDLLFFDKSANEYVVVELKHRDGGDGGSFQLFGYMRALQSHKADSEGRHVRGILLVGSATSDYRDLFTEVASGFDAQLVTYRLKFETEVVCPQPPALTEEQTVSREGPLFD